MNQHSAGPDDFLQAVRRAFAGAGVAALRDGEAGVLVFDSARWLAHVAAAAPWLGTEERQRAERFRFERDYVTYVLAHAVWRLALAGWLERDARAVPLLHAPFGQPLLPGTGWATSLSHSGTQVAIAAARAATLGVDIERSPSPRSLNDLSSTICTPMEAEAMQQLPAAEREQALLVLWTRKEAWLKAAGTGLSVDPATFAVMPGLAAGLPHAKHASCRLVDLALPDGLVGALALPLTLGRYGVHLLDEARIVHANIAAALVGR